MLKRQYFGAGMTHGFSQSKENQRATILIINIIVEVIFQGKNTKYVLVPASRV